MIPPTQAILALLAGKLLGKRRINHIDDLNFDAGAGLFAGLNVLPKTTYATANVVRKEADTMAVRFVDHWKEASGHFPARVILDSRATVYSGLSQLNQRGVGFITVRRRGAAMLRGVTAQPAGAWQRCQVIQAGT